MIRSNEQNINRTKFKLAFAVALNLAFWIYEKFPGSNVKTMSAIFDYDIDQINAGIKKGEVFIQAL